MYKFFTLWCLRFSFPKLPIIVQSWSALTFCLSRWDLKNKELFYPLMLAPIFSQAPYYFSIIGLFTVHISIQTPKNIIKAFLSSLVCEMKQDWDIFANSCNSWMEMRKVNNRDLASRWPHILYLFFSFMVTPIKCDCPILSHNNTMLQ